VRIVLRDDVEDLGRKGDIVEVRDGYARNYLVPRGLAIKATDGIVRQAEAMRRSRAAREERDRAAAEELAGRLAASPIRITARAGEGGKLFGSVTSADVAQAIADATGAEVDRRRIELDEPVKELGTTEVTVRLEAGVTARLTVEVVAGS
jgi:large subunit ribosomal protein L9